MENNKPPEQVELESKLAELDSLEDELSNLELELATLSAELHSFGILYYKVVGVKLARLDELTAQIAEKYAQLNPNNAQLQQNFINARIQAEETNGTVESVIKETSISIKFDDEIKSLYRDVAKKIHPDLATNQKDRETRTILMAAANSAYQERNKEKLRLILQEWNFNPANVTGSDIGSELIRTLRQIAQLKNRIAQIVHELQSIIMSDLYQLKIKVDKFTSLDKDGINEIKSQLDEEIALQERRLANISRAISRNQN